MMIVVFLLTALVIYGFGRLLVRYLGWPTSFAAVGRWLVALLVAGVLCIGLPGLVRSLRYARYPVPGVGLGELVMGFALLGLAVLGYVGWTRGELAREREQRLAEATRHQERRRALPPPPAAPTDEGFTPINDPPAPAAPAAPAE
ncbi:MAG: hypothetical protein JWM10_4156 [Myxococcaceae bacterium]|nr:hypothetical protein [Myxococcaceae bacterium]